MGLIRLVCRLKFLVSFHSESCQIIVHKISVIKKASIVSGTISVAATIHARPTNDHCFGSKFSLNRLGLPPFSRTSAKKYLLNSQLATSETENETGAETQPAVVSGNAPVSYWSIFSPVRCNSPRSLCESQLDPISLPFLKWRMNALHWSNEISPTPSPPLPKTQPHSQGSLLPVPTEGEPGNEVAKNTDKPFNRKIRLQFQMQQTFPARKFRNFEHSDLSGMFVFAEISEEEEEKPFTRLMTFSGF